MVIEIPDPEVPYPFFPIYCAAYDAYLDRCVFDVRGDQKFEDQATLVVIKRSDLEKLIIDHGMQEDNCSVGLALDTQDHPGKLFMYTVLY